MRTRRLFALLLAISAALSLLGVATTGLTATANGRDSLVASIASPVAGIAAVRPKPSPSSPRDSVRGFATAAVSATLVVVALGLLVLCADAGAPLRRRRGLTVRGPPLVN